MTGLRQVVAGVAAESAGVVAESAGEEPGMEQGGGRKVTD